MPNGSPELESYLLGLLMHNPRRVMQLAIATGLAIGYELASTGHTEIMTRCNADEEFTEAVCDLVMWHWVRSAKVGDISEDGFHRLMETIVTMAQAEYDHT